MSDGITDMYREYEWRKKKFSKPQYKHYERIIYNNIVDCFYPAVYSKERKKIVLLGKDYYDTPAKARNYAKKWFGKEKEKWMQ